MPGTNNNAGDSPRPKGASKAPLEQSWAATRVSMTEEQIQAAQVGVRVPLVESIRIVNYDPEWPRALRARGRADPDYTRRTGPVARTRRLDLGT